MPTRAYILEALQFTHIQSAIPMNTTGSAPLTLTYRFAGNSQPSDAIWSYSGWTAFTSAEKAAVEAVLDHIETFLNVKFVVAAAGDNDPDFNFGLVDLDPGTAGEGGGYPNGSGWDGQVVFNNDKSVFDLTSAYGTYAALHEIGHMLGLDHPFYDGDGETSKATLSAAYDNSHYTVMSYDSDPESGAYNNSMMIYDLLALQDIWGAARNNSGDNTYTGHGSYDVRVVWDTGGTDTFDASRYDKRVVLDLRPAHFSTFGRYEDVAIAYDVKIERAKGGTGDDRIFGNTWANVLDGNRGDDTIRGYGKGDTLKGAGGSDSLFGGKGNDRLNGGDGRDTLDGGKHDDILVGNAGADRFVFGDDYDRDVVRDFANNADRLVFDGLGTRAEVLSHASEVNGNVRFGFGGGDVLVVKNITLDHLADDLFIA